MKIYLMDNSMGCGGAEKQIYELSRAIDVKGVICLETDVHFIPNCPLIFLSNHKIRTHLILKFLSIPYYVWKLCKVVENDDIVISFVERANYVNILSKLLSRHRVIICERTTPSKSFARGFKRLNILLIKLLYRFADNIVCNSKGVADDLIGVQPAISSDCMRVIPNIFDVDLIRSLAAEKQLNKICDYEYILCVGRLTPAKGYYFSLGLYSKLVNKGRQELLIIAGDGELKNSLIEYAHSLGLKTYMELSSVSGPGVCFLGAVANPFSLMANCKLYLFNSLWEGYPNSLAEAVICGALCLSTKLKTGVPEIMGQSLQVYESLDLIKMKNGWTISELKSTGKDLDESELTRWVSAVEFIFSRHSSNLSQADLELDFGSTGIINKWEKLIGFNRNKIDATELT